jgi:hypothetical protein
MAAAMTGASSTAITTASAATVDSSAAPPILSPSNIVTVKSTLTSTMTSPRGTGKTKSELNENSIPIIVQSNDTPTAATATPKSATLAAAVATMTPIRFIAEMKKKTNMSTITPIRILNKSVSLESRETASNKELDKENNINNENIYEINTVNCKPNSGNINGSVNSYSNEPADGASIGLAMSASASNNASVTSSGGSGRLNAIRNWLKHTRWRKKDKHNSSSSTPPQPHTLPLSKNDAFKVSPTATGKLDNKKQAKHNTYSPFNFSYSMEKNGKATAASSPASSSATATTIKKVNKLKKLNSELNINKSPTSITKDNNNTGVSTNSTNINSKSKKSSKQQSTNIASSKNSNSPTNTNLNADATPPSASPSTMETQGATIAIDVDSEVSKINQNMTIKPISSTNASNSINSSSNFNLFR